MLRDNGLFHVDMEVFGESSLLLLLLQLALVLLGEGSCIAYDEEGLLGAT